MYNQDIVKTKRVKENTEYAATLTASLVNDEGDEIWEGTFMYDDPKYNPQIGSGCWPSYITDSPESCLEYCERFYNVINEFWDTLQVQHDLIQIQKQSISSDTAFGYNAN